MELGAVTPSLSCRADFNLSSRQLKKFDGSVLEDEVSGAAEKEAEEDGMEFRLKSDNWKVDRMLCR